MQWTLFRVFVSLLLFLGSLTNTQASDLSPQAKVQWQLLLFADNSRKPSEEILQKLMINPTTQQICTYPARYLWIAHYYPNHKFDFKKCKDLNTFTQKVPADKISVVFATEKVSNPVSMMGHIYLKLAGNKELKDVSHAVSLYVPTQGNPIKLFLDSFFFGAQGVFSLYPGQQTLDNYLYQEQRNIWEYELAIDPWSRKLLLYHIFELKHTRFKYYFHRFNCASMVEHLLNILNPASKQPTVLLRTPHQVLTIMQQNFSIKKTTIFLADRWKIEALTQELPLTTNSFKAIIKNPLEVLPTLSSLSPKQQWLTLELAKSFSRYKYTHHQQKKDKFLKEQLSLKQKQETISPNAILNLSPKNNPVNAPRSSQITLGYQHENGIDNFTLNFLPVYHTLSDDTTTNLNEYELKLAESQLIYNHQQKIKIDYLTIYSVTQLSPISPLLTNHSFHIDISYKDYYSAYRSMQLIGMWGKTVRFWKDIDFWTMLGASAELKKSYIYPTLFSGFVIREIYQLKTVIKFNISHNLKTKTLWRLQFIESIPISKNWSLRFEFSKIKNNKHHKKLTRSLLGLKYYF